MTYIIDGDTLENIADAIRGKTGATDTMTPDQMAVAIDGLEIGGGNTDLLDEMIDGSITECSNPRVKTIGDYCFNKRPSLVTVDFPLAMSIGDGAFQACAALSHANFLSVTTIGTESFRNCRSLISLNAPLLSYIGENAFYGCKSLVAVDFPSVTTIERAAFRICGLTHAIFPLVTSIAESLFHSSASLSTVSFPSATSVGLYAFGVCTNLTSVDLPKVTSITGGNSSSVGAFYSCTSLARLDLPSVTSIGGNTFNTCSALTTLILRNETEVCTLSGINVFGSTPIASGTGYIYVPDALVDDYKAATNWSTYADQIRPLSELPEEEEA